MTRIDLSPWHASNDGWTRHYSSCLVFLGAAVLNTGGWRVVKAVIKGNRQEYQHVIEGKSATVASAKRAASAALRIAVIAHRTNGGK